MLTCVNAGLEPARLRAQVHLELPSVHRIPFAAYLFAPDQQPDDKSPFEREWSEVPACDQQLDVPFDGMGDRAGRHTPR